VGALFGVGGGVLLVPALSFLAGMEFRQAIGVSLVAVAAMSIAGSTIFLRRGLVHIPIAVEFQFFSVLGASLASILSPLIPEGPLYFVFATLLLFAGNQMWRATPAREEPTREVRHAPGNLAAFGSGTLSGLLGVGGGILNTPVLHLIFGLPFRVAAGTSIFVLGSTAAAASWVFFVRGSILIEVAALAALGAGLGSGLVAWIGHRTEHAGLRTAFAGFLLLIALVMIWNGLARL